jgi:YHS domain-containing protein
VSEQRCPVCARPLPERSLRLRYEGHVYGFDSERCKRIFEENPDRYLDAEGEVLERPR